jgi:DNA-binding transcriptional MerR regulator
MTLAELAEASGLPARTVRFYIARSLLAGPVKAGRDAEYTGQHVKDLERIKRLQAEGHTLTEITRMLARPSARRASAEPEAWWQYAIAGDVTVWVKADSSPWRTRQIRAALDEFSRRIQPPEEEQE